MPIKRAVKKTAEKNVGGRPPKIVDWITLEKLVGFQCTGEECASVLRMDYEVLNNHIKRKYKYGFQEYLKKKGGLGRASLRRRQFKMAENNVSMAIWLGKQYLGQTDKVEEKVFSENHTIKIVQDEPRGKEKLDKYIVD